MSLLLLFADQEQQVQPDLPARRRRQTIIVRLPRRRRIDVLTPEEAERKRRERAGPLAVTHEGPRLSPDDLARAIAEDEELLLGLI